MSRAQVVRRRMGGYTTCWHRGDGVGQRATAVQKKGEVGSESGWHKGLGGRAPSAATHPSWAGWVGCRQSRSRRRELAALLLAAAIVSECISADWSREDPGLQSACNPGCRGKQNQTEDLQQEGVTAGGYVGWVANTSWGVQSGRHRRMENCSGSLARQEAADAKGGAAACNRCASFAGRRPAAASAEPGSEIKSQQTLSKKTSQGFGKFAQLLHAVREGRRQHDAKQEAWLMSPPAYQHQSKIAGMERAQIERRWASGQGAAGAPLEARARHSRPGCQRPGAAGHREPGLTSWPACCR